MTALAPILTGELIAEALERAAGAVYPVGDARCYGFPFGVAEALPTLTLQGWCRIGRRECGQGRSRLHRLGKPAVAGGCVFVDHDHPMRFPSDTNGDEDESDPRFRRGARSPRLRGPRAAGPRRVDRCRVRAAPVRQSRGRVPSDACGVNRSHRDRGIRCPGCGV
jgi:hypothetical protein